MISCPMCGCKNLTSHSEKTPLCYKGKTVEINSFFSCCDECREEFVTPSQLTLNDKEIREAKKFIDGLLSANEIRSIRKKLNLTQQQASLVFGGGRNSFSKYERSEVAQSDSMDSLLRLCSESKEFYLELLKLKGLVKLDASSQFKEDNFVKIVPSFHRRGMEDNVIRVIINPESGCLGRRGCWDE